MLKAKLNLNSPKSKAALLLAALILCFGLLYRFFENDRVENKKLSDPLKGELVGKNNIGENDSSFAKKLIEMNLKEISSTATSTLSDEVSKSLLLFYALSKKPGAPADIKEKLTAKLSEELSFESKKYDRSSVKLQKSKDLRKYKKDLEDAISPLKEIPDYELDIVAKALRYGDKKAYEDLLNAAKAYSKAIENLLKIEVPEDLLVPHLSLLNAYERFKDSLLLLNKSKNDTILAYVALPAFLEAEEKILASNDAFLMYFKLNLENEN